MKTTLHLIDILPQAQIDASRANYVEIQPVVLNREPRMALFQHPMSAVTFAPIQLGHQPLLDFEIGLSQVVWGRFNGVVQFEIVLINDGQEHHVFEAIVSPKFLPWQRKWMPHTIRLDRFAEKLVQLRFRTQVRGPSAFAWAVWADPILTRQIPEKVSVPRHDPHRHVFLITADALSQRFLGCYGSEYVKTPHIDQLASESVLLEQAWTQSTTTLGSYASILTGLYPHEHGVMAEWGTFPTDQKMNLTRILGEQGYHSAFFNSEAELGKPELGFSRAFDEAQPVVANPAQDGSVTARRFNRWLEERPEKPLFCWLQFFDTHPPNSAPTAFLNQYYTGDPTRQRHQPELVKSIYGIETMAELDIALDALKHGFISSLMVTRLHDTALALSGQRNNGPDMTEHLRGLGPEARLGLSEVAFGGWLLAQLDHYRAEKQFSQELVAWLQALVGYLTPSQDQILTWLKSVTDFRYPVAQHYAAISYLDTLVHSLLESLHAHDLYEQSTIILTSPHGEILHDMGIYFHHHVIHPQVFSIPMIIKLPGRASARRISGHFDLIDLMPTLLGLLGFDHPGQCSGHNYSAQLRTGSQLPRSYSYVSDMLCAMNGLIMPPYLLVRADADCALSRQWRVRAGDKTLFRIDGDQMFPEPLGPEIEVYQQMDQLLDNWHPKTGA